MLSRRTEDVAIINHSPDHTRGQSSPHKCCVLFRLHSPGLGGIDGLPVDLQPLAHSKKPFLEDGNDQSIFSWSNVEKIVASQTDCLNQFLKRAETTRVEA